MKRQTSQQLAARRREVVSPAHSNLVHGGWPQAAIASHLKIPQGTVSRDLAAMREFWRDFPVCETVTTQYPRRIFPRMTPARDGRFDAHIKARYAHNRAYPSSRAYPILAQGPSAIPRSMQVKSWNSKTRRE
jgi:hypothetical protein